MPREGSTGPAVPALGSREGAEVFLAQPPESWATKEAAAGVGKHLGMTLMIDVRCNLGQVTEHLMPAPTLLLSSFDRRESEAVYSNSSWSVADQDWTRHSSGRPTIPCLSPGKWKKSHNYLQEK
ncbi:uncharacterized protein WM294_006419 isoform 1-T1 [Sarcoramphus papa]